MRRANYIKRLLIDFCHYVYRDMHNLPETELIADDLGGNVTETVAANCSPRFTVKYF